MKPRVTVVDYGRGNLHSVLKALAHVGADISVAEDGAALAEAERVVLPGVGAFSDGMTALGERGHVDALRRHAAAGRPLAGICLGLQFLFDESDEFGPNPGLGLIPGRVVRVPGEGVKVPHVGWSRLHAPPARSWSGTALDGAADGMWAYFLHSYHAIPADARDILADCRHGAHTLTAAVSRGSVVGFQFHPEKSGEAGLALLSRFIHT